jgi:shikimate kinase
MILKLKRTPGLYLVGFMGSGKSTVGRHVAKSLGWRFADLDEDIESRERLSIPEIFDARGEDEFRRLESFALHRRVEDIARGMPWVIAVGGGCYTRPDNMDLIQNHGVTIWLDASLEMIRSRIAHSSHRPLARDPEKMAQLYEERRSCYERADFHIVVGEGGSHEAAERILALPLF